MKKYAMKFATLTSPKLNDVAKLVEDIPFTMLTKMQTGNSLAKSHDRPSAHGCAMRAAA